VRTCDQCGTRMPPFVARKTIGPQRVCQRCAALENPIADKQRGKNPEEWYHGTSHDFDEFGDPGGESSLSFEEKHPGEDSSHWNTLLGNHFTSDHAVARAFSEGEHASASNQSGESLSHVIHVKLHLKNPKVYASEHDMDQEAHEFEHARGNTYHRWYSENPEEDPRKWAEDEDYDPDFDDDHGEARLFRDDEEPFSKGEPDPRFPYAFHPKATGWLNNHPDKHGIAMRFRDRLEDQGHDGIVYGNEFEQSEHGKSAKSAVAFEPHQIEITQHHYGNRGCLSPQEAAERKPPPRGQMTLPGLENPERKLPKERRPDVTKKWPETWTPAYFERPRRYVEPPLGAPGWHPELPVHGSKRAESYDTGRLSAPLPQECWDRYYGRHTGAQGRTAASWTMKYTTYGPDGGYVDKEREVEGPLYHGSRSKRLAEGDLIVPGRKTNPWGDEGAKSKHVFFTQNLSTAQSYADDAGGHVYEVEPTGEFATDYNGEDYKTHHPLRVVRRYTPGKTAVIGEESAKQHAGKQDVYAVRSGDTMVNLCGYHADVHVGNSNAADSLADQTGIGTRERSAEKLGPSRKGSCAACNRDTDYQLKLLTPRWMQNAQDSRTRRRPGKPLRTKPLPTLKQSENHLVALAEWEQGELFKTRPAAPPHSPKADWHKRMIDKYSEPETDPDDEVEDCNDCGEEHSVNEGHRECRTCGERHHDYETTQDHETGYTDWDEHYDNVGDEIHRGMPMRLPDWDRIQVHGAGGKGSSLPHEEQARILMNHIKSKNLGMHWTDHRPAADEFTTRTANADDTQVIVHARKPDREHIETDWRNLKHGEVFPYDEHEEAEVPLREDAPVHITGISWRPKTYGDGHGTYPINDWIRHDFAEPHHHIAKKEDAAMAKLPSLRTIAHDATENEAIRHCPFCGGGKIIGRADGSVECEFCHHYFTVQVQPQYPNFPQTINGMPQDIPGMPGQVEQPGMDGGAGGLPPGDDEQGGDEDAPPWAQDGGQGYPDDAAAAKEGEQAPPGDDDDDNQPPPFAKKSSAFRTATGAVLSEDDYARHLAIRLAPDRDAMIARIREERGA
jgi:DNA-directed RNA polymerase subunit M/transcription elongation factor TFIIS